MDVCLLLAMSALAVFAVLLAWIDDHRQREERRRMLEDIARLWRDVEELRRALANVVGNNTADSLKPVETQAAMATDNSGVKSGEARAAASARRSGFVYPDRKVIPLPDTTALRALPEAARLPTIGTDAIPWAWGAAEFRHGAAVVVPAAELASEKPPTFILGDLHGDAASLRRILAHVLSISEDARVVFLGDLVDRSTGETALECARLFIWAARTHPGQFLWLRGNHDYLAWNESEGRFCTSVEPHEFADFLNWHPELRKEGIALGEIMATLPVGAALGNVWLSHGGVLQDDETGLRSFTGLASMTDEMRHDLIWSRMRDVPSKLAHRGTSGAEVGLKQATGFAGRLRETDGAEIAHIVCAHQHESRDGFGYLPYDRCFTEGLTCQCVCSFENAAAFDGPAAPVFLKIDCEGTPVPICFGPDAARAGSDGAHSLVSDVPDSSR